MGIKMKKCMIFAAGSFDAGALIGKTQNDIMAQRGECFCIAADGGLDIVHKLRITPDLIIGDMDSLKNKELPEHFAGNKYIQNKYIQNKYIQNKFIQIKRLPREKDDTDTLAAIKEGLGAGCGYFEIYGALGGRLDHTIANIQCLYYLLNHNAYGCLYGKGQRIELVRNSRLCFPEKLCRRNRMVSVFALGETAFGVTQTGLKYAFQNADVRPDFPMGISNEFIGSEASIEVKNGTLLVCLEDL
ncbi:MAG: thiamine diphosphokinase [Lachnospiraceae bacterium]|nr:thiamine diphosphokinase [Lachnospiraceae bacterium]